MKKFRLDKQNALFLGVCSGLANSIGIDVTLVRIGAVVLTLVGGFPWTLLAYGLTAWLAPGVPQVTGSAPSGDIGRTARDDVRRRADVEAYVANPNSNLAHEIETLR